MFDHRSKLFSSISQHGLMFDGFDVQTYNRLRIRYSQVEPPLTVAVLVDKANRQSVNRLFHRRLTQFNAPLMHTSGDVLKVGSFGSDMVQPAIIPGERIPVVIAGGRAFPRPPFPGFSSNHRPGLR